MGKGGEPKTQVRVVRLRAQEVKDPDWSFKQIIAVKSQSHVLGRVRGGKTWGNPFRKRLHVGGGDSDAISGWGQRRIRGFSIQKTRLSLMGKREVNQLRSKQLGGHTKKRRKLKGDARLITDLTIRLFLISSEV